MLLEPFAQKAVARFHLLSRPARHNQTRRPIRASVPPPPEASSRIPFSSVQIPYLGGALASTPKGHSGTCHPELAPNFKLAHSNPRSSSVSTQLGIAVRTLVADRPPHISGQAQFKVSGSRLGCL